MRFYEYTRFYTMGTTVCAILSGMLGFTSSAIGLGCAAIVCALWDVANEIRDKK